jgi:Ca2+-binding RTX toxin-like protein
MVSGRLTGTWRRIACAAAGTLAMAVATTSASANLPSSTDPPISRNTCDARASTIGFDNTKNGGSGPDVIYGTALNDKIFGNGGDDVIYGMGGKDKIVGGPGDDKIAGDYDQNEGNNSNADVIYGDSGDDVLVGDSAGFSGGGVSSAAASDDCIVGWDGGDVVVGDNYTRDQYNVFGGADYDILMGDEGNDKLFGDSYVSGTGDATSSAGNDWLAGSSGIDLVVGDAGSASGSVTLTQGGRDSVNAGPGGDTLVGDSWIRDGSGTATGAGSDGFFPIPDGKAAGIHALEGGDTAFGDNDVRGSSPNTDGGNDEIGLFDGADTAYGGPGDDKLTGDNTCPADATYPGWNNTPYDNPNGDPYYRTISSCIQADVQDDSQANPPGADPPANQRQDIGGGGNDDLQGQNGDDSMYGYWGAMDSCVGGFGNDFADTTDWGGSPSCDTAVP